MKTSTSSRTSVRSTAAATCRLSLLTLIAVGCDTAPPPAASEPSSPAREEAPQEPPVDTAAFRDAAYQGDVETVQRAVEQDVDVDAADGDGRTALMLASYDGRTDIVRLLVEHEAAVDRTDSSGRTALMYASTGANLETVQLLLEAGADPDTADASEGFTALMFAAAEGQLEVVQALLKHNAQKELTDVDGDTAHDFARQNGHVEVAELLSP